MRRAAIGYLITAHRIRLHVTIRILLTQRQQTEDAPELELRCHLILGFHADVIDVVLHRVGEDDELVSAQFVSSLRLEGV